MSAQTFTIGQFDAGDSLVRKYHLPFSKFDGTAAPGVSDDDTAGYVAGSLWADTTNHNVYVCISNATGAAVWLQIQSGGSVSIGGSVGGSTNYDILSIDGSGNLSQISPSTAGYVLTSNGVAAAATFNAIGTGSGLTAHGVLLGEGTEAFGVTAAMTDGQLLVGATGTNPTPQTISGAFTLTADGVATIANAYVTNAMLADMDAWTFKIRNAGTAGAPSDADAATITTYATPVAGDFGIFFKADGSIVKVDVANFPVGATSPLTTKGDLWGFDIADNRVPVGADTEVLTADSTQPLGVKWKSPFPAMIARQWMGA